MTSHIWSVFLCHMKKQDHNVFANKQKNKDWSDRLILNVPLMVGRKSHIFNTASIYFNKRIGASYTYIGGDRTSNITF